MPVSTRSSRLIAPFARMSGRISLRTSFCPAVTGACCFCPFQSSKWRGAEKCRDEERSEKSLADAPRPKRESPSQFVTASRSAGVDSFTTSAGRRSA